MKKQTTEEVKRDRRKADYTDRPLTEEEKDFAADTDNYNHLFGYMRIYRLDQEEWYDILIIPYLQAVKKYLSISRLQEYTFKTILFKTLDNARSNYYMNLNRQKRIPSNMIFSLDWEMDDMNTDSERKIDPWMQFDPKQSVEETVLDKEMIIEILHLLNDMQRKIFIKLLDGYTHNIIAGEIGMNIWAMKRMIKQIKCVIADYLSM